MSVRWLVVGAGAAGCAVAAELATTGDALVTLLEAGPADRPSGIDSPSFFDALAAPGRTYPGPHRRGRGMGGSSAINGMVAGRAWAAGMPIEPVRDDEVGPVGDALRRAVSGAEPVRLIRHGGHRVTADDHFLSGLPADRFQLRAGADVTSIVVEDGRATGVVLVDGEQIMGDAIAVCAGAIGTPAILLRSGIIDGVGDGLRNHPGVPILLSRTGDPVDPHSSPITVSWRNGDVDVLAVEHLGPEEPGWAMLLTVAMTTSSSGRVRLDPQDPGGPPLVEWQLDPSDRARLARSALRTTGALEHPAFAAIVGEVVIGDGPAGVFHWASTCAIGRVLDDDGAVRGIERLFVADASAFAELPVEHLMLPTIAMARRLGARLGARVW